MQVVHKDVVSPAQQRAAYSSAVVQRRRQSLAALNPVQELSCRAVPAQPQSRLPAASSCPALHLQVWDPTHPTVGIDGMKHYLADLRTAFPDFWCAGAGRAAQLAVPCSFKSFATLPLAQPTHARACWLGGRVCVIACC